jgi:hypothetical protein
MSLLANVTKPFVPVDFPVLVFPKRSIFQVLSSRVGFRAFPQILDRAGKACRYKHLGMDKLKLTDALYVRAQNVNKVNSAHDKEI